MAVDKRDLKRDVFRKVKSFLPVFEIASATAVITVISIALFLTAACFNVDPRVFGLEHTAVADLRDLPSLVCNIAILWYFGSELEKSVGTVKYCYLFVVFSVASGLLCLLLDYIVYGVEGSGVISGFTSVVFAMIGMSSTRSRMRRALLFGVSVPTVLAPWVLLLIAFVVPGTAFLCNVSGIVVGEIYGVGLCFILDLSESRASIVDKKLPFKLLRKLRGALYVPASVTERRTTLLKKYNPPPGSYPTQAYVPVQDAQNQDPYSRVYGNWGNHSHNYGNYGGWPSPGHGHSHTAAHQCSSHTPHGTQSNQMNSSWPAASPGYYSSYTQGSPVNLPADPALIHTLSGACPQVDSNGSGADMTSRVSGGTAMGAVSST
ncbi:RHBD2 protein, partial [Polyodon spathula]|nr:RHBD2 protein [Polyodon spathula]